MCVHMYVHDKKILIEFHYKSIHTHARTHSHTHRHACTQIHIYVLYIMQTYKCIHTHNYLHICMHRNLCMYCIDSNFLFCWWQLGKIFIIFNFQALLVFFQCILMKEQLKDENLDSEVTTKSTKFMHLENYHICDLLSKNQQFAPLILIIQWFIKLLWKDPEV